MRDVAETDSVRERVARALRERVERDTVRFEACEARLDEVILASHTINERVLRIEGAPEVIADAALAAVADAPGLAEALVLVLLDHHPGEGWPWDDTHELRAGKCWCGWITPSEYFGWRLRAWHREHVSAHLADVVRAWIRPRP